MSDNQVVHKPTPWIGPRIPGHDFLEILFSTLQESWGIRICIYRAQCFGCDLYPAAAELARSHITTLSNLVSETSADMWEECFDSEEELIHLDQMPQRELVLRSEMLAKLSNQTIRSYPSFEEWDEFAEALAFISSAHAALSQRLRVLRERMAEHNLAPETIDDNTLEELAPFKC